MNDIETIADLIIKILTCDRDNETVKIALTILCSLISNVSNEIPIISNSDKEVIDPPEID